MDNEVPDANITPVPYIATLMFSNFDTDTIGKAVIEIVSKTDRNRATINIYIQSNTSTWTQDYNCNGNPVTNIKQKKRAAAVYAAKENSIITAGPTTTAGSSPIYF